MPTDFVTGKGVNITCPKEVIFRFPLTTAQCRSFNWAILVKLWVVKQALTWLEYFRRVSKD